MRETDDLHLVLLKYFFCEKLISVNIFLKNKKGKLYIRIVLLSQMNAHLAK